MCVGMRVEGCQETVHSVTVMRSLSPQGHVICCAQWEKSPVEPGGGDRERGVLTCIQNPMWLEFSPSSFTSRTFVTNNNNNYHKSSVCFNLQIKVNMESWETQIYMFIPASRVMPELSFLSESHSHSMSWFPPWGVGNG
ncbi:hypothetical protein SKAU_G00148990 [Synaphobranchus kaupii]|uniref:Uncharacterized protein n=1 Tax=Synaphobranchus kaupii TaxID=118154 RepID=A0A9Q1FUT0_SYNKA|nr:hypothetical protein SKAU_G00148990 [Synaphobranchus kaupii]